MYNIITKIIEYAPPEHKIIIYTWALQAPDWPGMT